MKNSAAKFIFKYSRIVLLGLKDIEWTNDGQILAISTQRGGLHCYLTKLHLLGDTFGTKLAELSILPLCQRQKLSFFLDKLKRFTISRMSNVTNNLYSLESISSRRKRVITRDLATERLRLRITVICSLESI